MNPIRHFPYTSNIFCTPQRSTTPRPPRTSRLRSAFSVPLGYENETGFHYGVEPKSTPPANLVIEGGTWSGSAVMARNAELARAARRRRARELATWRALIMALSLALEIAGLVVTFGAGHAHWSLRFLCGLVAIAALFLFVNTAMESES